MISPSQRPLPDNTQHSQQTHIHAPGGIRTHNLSRRVAAHPRLRPRGHTSMPRWDSNSRGHTSMPRWDSNSQSQQANGRTPTPLDHAARRPLGPADVASIVHSVKTGQLTSTVNDTLDGRGNGEMGRGGERRTSHRFIRAVNIRNTFF